MPDCGRCNSPLRESETEDGLHFYCVRCGLVYCASKCSHVEGEEVDLELDPEDTPPRLMQKGAFRRA